MHIPSTATVPHVHVWLVWQWHCNVYFWAWGMTRHRGKTESVSVCNKPDLAKWLQDWVTSQESLLSSIMSFSMIVCSQQSTSHVNALLLLASKKKTCSLSNFRTSPGPSPRGSALQILQATFTGLALSLGRLPLTACPWFWCIVID